MDADHRTGQNELMSPDEERWAEAAAVSRIYGDRAALHVAERIGALAATNDTAGVERWREIARRLAEITQTPRQ